MNIIPGPYKISPSIVTNSLTILGGMEELGEGGMQSWKVVAKIEGADGGPVTSQQLATAKLLTSVPLLIDALVHAHTTFDMLSTWGQPGDSTAMNFVVMKDIAKKAHNELNKVLLDLR